MFRLTKPPTHDQLHRLLACVRALRPSSSYILAPGTFLSEDGGAYSYVLAEAAAFDGVQWASPVVRLWYIREGLRGITIGTTTAGNNWCPKGYVAAYDVANILELSLKQTASEEDPPSAVEIRPLPARLEPPTPIDWDAYHGKGQQRFPSVAERKLHALKVLYGAGEGSLMPRRPRTASGAVVRSFKRG